MIHGLTAEDIRWTEERAIEFVTEFKLDLVDAIELAAYECAERLKQRAMRATLQELAAAARAEARRDEQRVRQRAEREAADAEQRAEMALRGAPAQRPTLRTSLGDLLTAKGGSLVGAKGRR
jgi:hypothetical protein